MQKDEQPNERQGQLVRGKKTGDSKTSKIWERTQESTCWEIKVNQHLQRIVKKEADNTFTF